jgi:putative flippase GtrA
VKSGRILLGRFLAVGLLATVAQYAVVAVAATETSAAVAGALGYFVGSVTSYVVNRSYTFGFRGSHLGAAARFYAMVAGGWVVTIACMWVLADALGYNLWFAQVLATGLCLLVNYTISRHWVFKEET